MQNIDCYYFTYDDKGGYYYYDAYVTDSDYNPLDVSTCSFWDLYGISTSNYIQRVVTTASISNYSPGYNMIYMDSSEYDRLSSLCDKVRLFIMA